MYKKIITGFTLASLYPIYTNADVSSSNDTFVVRKLYGLQNNDFSRWFYSFENKKPVTNINTKIGNYVISNLIHVEPLNFKNDKLYNGSILNSLHFNNVNNYAYDKVVVSSNNYYTKPIVSIKNNYTKPIVSVGNKSTKINDEPYYIDKKYTNNDKLNYIMMSNNKAVKNNTMIFRVYVDSGVQYEAKAALNDWKSALKREGFNLELRYSSSLKNVDLAILEADNKTTRVDYGYLSVGTNNDSKYEFSNLAGLATKTKRVKLVTADSNDKYNKRGLREGYVLSQAKNIVQLNTDNVRSYNNRIKVLKHEIGHVFGLGHDDHDTLMTTYYDDPIFSGVIGSKDSRNAVYNIKKGL